MAGETIITLVGNLTDDPELKFTPSGAAVANFTVASTPRTFDKQSQQWQDGEAMFIRAAAWREMAEHCAESLTKGMRVVVTGALKVRGFERQDGSKGTSVEINVDEIGPSLRYATAKVSKATRSGGQQQGGQQQQPQQANPWSSAPQQPQQQGGWGGQGQGWGGQGQADEPPF